jgi:hypothetical protein
LTVFVDEAVRDRAYNSLRLLPKFGLLATIAICLIFPFGCEQRRGLPIGVKKSRQIMIALMEYHETNGHIPFDERGPEYALYKLHDLIDADQFRLRDGSPTERPRWDHDGRRLIGGDVVYINQPLTESKDFGAIIFMGTPISTANWTYVGHLGFGPWTATFAAVPDRRILGSFLTVDDLYIVGSALFDDLATTHVVPGQSWSTTSDSDHGLISSTVGDRVMRYHFVDHCIHRCEIETPRGTIVETFRTDPLGQIIGMTRSPPDWRQVLGAAGHKL